MIAPPDSSLDAEVVAGRGAYVACEHAERCGGCPIIGLPYLEQLAANIVDPYES